MTARSPYLRSMRRRMMIENGLGFVLNALVASLSSAIFCNRSRDFRYEAFPISQVLIMLMTLSFSLMVLWLILTLYLFDSTNAKTTKLNAFLVVATLSATLGLGSTAHGLRIILEKNGIAMCQVGTGAGQSYKDVVASGTSICSLFLPVTIIGLITFVVYPIAIYIGRVVSLSKSCGPMPFHDATLDELANRAEARSIDAEVAGLKVVTSNTSSI